jgi:hypothetical protein
MWQPRPMFEMSAHDTWSSKCICDLVFLDNDKQRLQILFFLREPVSLLSLQVLPDRYWGWTLPTIHFFPQWLSMKPSGGRNIIFFFSLSNHFVVVYFIRSVSHSDMFLSMQLHWPYICDDFFFFLTMLWLLIPGFIINNLAETGDEVHIV